MYIEKALNIIAVKRNVVIVINVSNTSRVCLQYVPYDHSLRIIQCGPTLLIDLDTKYLVSLCPCLL